MRALRKTLVVLAMSPVMLAVMGISLVVASIVAPFRGKRAESLSWWRKGQRTVK